MSVYRITTTEEALEDIVKIYGSFDGPSRFKNYQMKLEKDSKGNLSELIIEAELEKQRVPIITIPLEKSIQDEHITWSV